MPASRVGHQLVEDALCAEALQHRGISVALLRRGALVVSRKPFEALNLGDRVLETSIDRSKTSFNLAQRVMRYVRCGTLGPSWPSSRANGLQRGIVKLQNPWSAQLPLRSVLAGWRMACMVLGMWTTGGLT